jgi:hypothetical protein
MKYLLLSAILFSCTTQRGFVIQEARMEIKGNRAKIKFTGPKKPLKDTVMIIDMIRKNF